MILKQVLVEEGNELDQCTLSNVEDGSMITQYGIMEIVQLVPDRVNLTPTQVKLLEEFG